MTPVYASSLLFSSLHFLDVCARFELILSYIVNLRIMTCGNKFAFR